MNYLKESVSNTRKNITSDGRSLSTSSTYIPPRIVLSSQITRKDCNSNPEETDAREDKKSDDVDEIFQNFSGQIQDKLKQCRENKDRLKSNKPSTRKANSFVGEFLEVKKRFEADFVANTRIYQSSSQNFTNSETIRDINNEECRMQMSSADKYMAMLQSKKNAQSSSFNKAVNKQSLQAQNWVPGAMMTKIKLDSDSTSTFSGGLIKNQEPLQNSVVKDRERKWDEVNKQLYGFIYKSAPAFKRAKSKKKSFIEEFCELRDKLGVTPRSKIKNREESSESFNAENEKEETPGSNFKQRQRTEKINNRIVTPFGSIGTSFFRNYDPAETSKYSGRKRSSIVRDNITADWVKGGIIQRNMTKNFIDIKNREHTPENMDEPEDLYGELSPNCVLQNNKSIEEESELYFTPRNKYSRASPSYTPANNTPQTNRENDELFKDFYTSTIRTSTMLCSRNVNIHRPNFVITETKVTKLMFPSHQMKLFQNH